MKKYLLAVVSLFVISSATFSQTAENNAGFMDGYVIKTNRDTLFGEVKFRQENDRMLSNIRFRENKDAGIKYFSASELIAFKLGRFHYVVNDGLYLQLISKGEKVDIHERREHTYQTMYSSTGAPLTTRSDQEESHIILIKKDKTKLDYKSNNKLIDKKMKVRLITFFNDAPELVSKIKEGFFTNADIIYMAYEYNEPGKYKLKVISEKEYKDEEKSRKRGL